MTTNFLGIDPSLTGTGICVLSEDGLEHIQTINTKNMRDMVRLMHLRSTLSLIIAEYDIHHAAIEGYAFAIRGRSNTLFSTGEWGGIARLLLTDAQIEYVEIPPTSVKKYCTGNGRADKKEMMLTVKERWEIELKDHNQADAYVIAKMGQEVFELKRLDYSYATCNPTLGKILKSWRGNSECLKKLKER